MTLIAVVSAKGGQGKSTLSNAIALASDAAIITNELHSSIDQVLEPGRVKKVSGEADLPPIKKGVTVVFDGAQGIHQNSTRQAIEKADHVLIPVKPEGSGIEEIKRLAWGLADVPIKRASVVVMMVLENEFLEIKEKVEGRYPEVKVFWLPRSILFEKQGEDGESLHQKAKQKGRDPARLRKTVLPHFEALMAHIQLPILR